MLGSVTLDLDPFDRGRSTVGGLGPKRLVPRGTQIPYSATVGLAEEYEDSKCCEPVPLVFFDCVYGVRPTKKVVFCREIERSCYICGPPEPPERFLLSLSEVVDPRHKSNIRATVVYDRSATDGDHSYCPDSRSAISVSLLIISVRSTYFSGLELLLVYLSAATIFLDLSCYIQYCFSSYLDFCIVSVAKLHFWYSGYVFENPKTQAWLKSKRLQVALPW
ncbi:hypothetical protein M9H77_01431 [Catharanthus roseus]|uniref:Uncharacterized protein n=1 Tax=Catharanthus roseus TaxID=4058 RepID=A0ACC0C5V2_CATRO|nr:hypothetical protein M9H77_01431 [Catharanthus roseus]